MLLILSRGWRIPRISRSLIPASEMRESEMLTESDVSAELLWLIAKLAEVVSNNNILEERARKDIQAILDSRFWKMTRPIRFLAEKLRGRDACSDDLHTGLSPDSGELAAVSAPPPFRKHGTRIGVDISTLCLFNYETGTQRVVRQIARHLVESMPPGDVVLLDVRLGWPADASWRVVPSEQAKSTADWPVLDFKTLLLLDASWHLVDYFETWDSRALAEVLERFDADEDYRRDLRKRAALFVPTDWSETLKDIMHDRI